MGERSDSIKSHIDDTRRELDENLSELTERVRPSNVMRANPGAMLAAAIAGGALIGYIVISAFRRKTGPVAH